MKLIIAAIGGIILVVLFQMRLADVRQFEVERKVRLSFLTVRGLLGMPNSKDTFDEMVADAKLHGANFVYQPQSSNPLPVFLPDHAYVVYPDRSSASNGLFIAAHFHYWLQSDVEVTLSWEGKISGMLDPWP